MRDAVDDFPFNCYDEFPILACGCWFRGKNRTLRAPATAPRNVTFRAAMRLVAFTTTERYVQIKREMAVTSLLSKYDNQGRVPRSEA
jgi:hypothetical protein